MDIKEAEFQVGIARLFAPIAALISTLHNRVRDVKEEVTDTVLDSPAECLDQDRLGLTVASFLVAADSLDSSAAVFRGLAMAIQTRMKWPITERIEKQLTTNIAGGLRGTWSFLQHLDKFKVEYVAQLNEGLERVQATLLKEIQSAAGLVPQE